MRRVTGGSLVGMEPLLSLQTSIGEAFEVNWATCQQLADEGSQRDPTRIETHSTGHPNVPAALWKDQKALWRQVVKAPGEGG